MINKKIGYGLVLLLIIDIATYVSFHVQDEGLSNIGLFILWVFSILLLFGIFGSKDTIESKDKAHFLIRLIAKIMFISALFVIIYNAEYVMASIWTFFVLWRISENIKEDKKMFNKVILVGNLTRDIELRYSQAGMGIANTAIATTRKFTSNGEKKEEVCFVDITFFARSAEVANQYLRKGSKILVEGRLNFDQWVDQNGQKKSKHSVIVETMQMLDSKGDSVPTPDNSQSQQQSYQSPQQQMPSSNNVPVIDIDEDEIPF